MHELVRDLRGDMARTCLDVEALFNTFFDEDGPGASSSMAKTAVPFSLSGLVSKAGGVPASLRGGAIVGTSSPFPFFLFGAKGSSLGFF